MQKKHLLVLSSWYPNPEKPFLGNFVERQVELLSTIYDVTLVDVQYISSIKHVDILEKNIDNRNEIRIHIPKSFSRIRKLFLTYKLCKEVFEKIKSVDFVYGNILFNKGLLFVQAKKHFQVPLIINESASYFNEVENWTILQKIIFKIIDKHTYKYVVVSELFRKQLSKLTKKPIFIIPNGVDDTLFKPFPKNQTSDKIHFLHISTLDKSYKNPYGILNVFLKLYEQYGEKFRLDIVTDEKFEEFQSFVNLNNLQNVVFFHYRIPYCDIPQFYTQADYFVLFSKSETFSCVLAESWVTGTPTITTEVGIADGMSSENGILFNDENDLLEILSAIINNRVEFDSSKIVKNSSVYKNSEIPHLFLSVFN